MKLPEKILYCRKCAGLSQEALAERLGVSRQAVSKWEAGEAAPEAGRLTALAAELGVSVDWLLSEDGPEQTRAQSGDWTEGLPKLLKRAARRWGWLAGIYCALLGLFMSGMGAFLLSHASAPAGYTRALRGGRAGALVRPAGHHVLRYGTRQDVYTVHRTHSPGRGHIHRRRCCCGPAPAQEPRQGRELALT